MLQEVKGAVRGRRLTLFGRRWSIEDVEWPTRHWRAIQAEQTRRPVALYARDGRTFWLFEDRLFRTDDDLAPDDVHALVRDRERRARRRLERAHAALAGDAAPRRRPPAREVRQAVFERDGGRCVACGSAFDLQYDHVIPVALGGADTVENLQILCAPCNRDKGAALG